MLSGCALAVADKEDIEQVGWDDLVVFSVNHDCVKQRITPFEVRYSIRSTKGGSVAYSCGSQLAKRLVDPVSNARLFRRKVHLCLVRALWTLPAS